MRIVERTPLLGRTVLGFSRARTAERYLRRPQIEMVKWIFRSRERTNFTYDLTERNKRHLASLIADVLNVQHEEISAYMREIDEDGELGRHIAELTAASPHAFEADKEAHYGRRIGWYAFARALKPATVIETGVDKGLGSCVLTAALKKNAEEGFAGRYFGTDINPAAGYLLSGVYADYGEVLYGDSIESLKTFEGTVDLFINDSDHSERYEAEEYVTISPKLSERAILLGDNCHVTDALLEYSLENGRRFVFFRENPSGHWYPGAGIGISFRRSQERDPDGLLPD
jgi:hypothetical protein